MDRLLAAFAACFSGVKYNHRISTTGDRVAAYLYDDLYSLNGSPKLVSRIAAGHEVVNVANTVKGKAGRRGDGTFGQLVPGVQGTLGQEYLVRRGPIASLRIAAEAKFVVTKQLAQIDRVITDLRNQADTFRGQSRDVITVGITAVNFSDSYTSYEGDNVFVAKYPPSRDAPETTARLESMAKPAFDEFLVMKFRATNVPPYPFEWVNEAETRMLYSSILLRLSNEYERRF